LGSSVGSGNPVDQSVWTMAKVGLLCVALVHVGAQRQPLITVDLFSDTYDLLSDASSFAWKTAGVDEMIAKVPVEDMKKKILEQTGPVPPAVHENIAQAHAAHVQVKAAVIERIGKAIGKAYEPLNQAAVGVINGFERAVPSHKGMVPKTLGNFVLFVFYKACVLYVLLKVILTVWRMVFGITHCVCCCLCCCRCRRGAHSTKKHAGKKAGSANGKAANGKAAPAPSNKAAAKPAATKKK